MAKISLASISSQYQSTTKVNQNFTDIAAEFQNKVLYRDNPTGEQNTMQNDIDMNGYRLLNVAGITGLESASASITKAITWATQLDGTGTHSISAGYLFKMIEVSASSSVTAVAEIMTDADANWGGAGSRIGFIQKGVGPIKFVGATGVTLRSKGTVRTNGQYAQAWAHYRGSDVWYIYGDLSSS